MISVRAVYICDSCRWEVVRRPHEELMMPLGWSVPITDRGKHWCDSCGIFHAPMIVVRHTHKAPSGQ